MTAVPTSAAAQLGGPPITVSEPAFFAMSVSDLEASTAWYARVFGTETVGDVTSRDGRGRARVMVAGDLVIELIAYEGSIGADDVLPVGQHRRWMDWLAVRGHLAGGTRRNLLGNRLVLIAPKTSRLAITIRSGFDLAGALGDGRLALADPDHVPAGIYARQALIALGAWRGLRSRSARTRDVRAALALVGRGEAAAGIVYATDAAASRKVRTVGTFPTASHRPIVYPVALVKGRADAEARRFYGFLLSPAAGTIFARHGFVVE